MTIALQVIISGLAAGGVYGLFAAGYSLIYRLTGIIHFAFGDLVGLGIFATLLVLSGTSPVSQSGAHEPRFLLAIVVGLAVCILAGAGTYVGLVQPYLSRGSTIGWVAGTAAVAFAIRAVIGATFQRSSYVFPDPLPFHRVGTAGYIHLGGAQVQARAFFVAGLAIALALGSAWFLEHTRYGRALRSVADDREGARVVGVPVELLVTLAFALVGAIAMLAAVAAAPGEAVNANTGTLLGLKGLVAALAVRFGPPLWAFAAGPRARRGRVGDRERPPRRLAARALVPRGAAARLRAAADLAAALARGARGARVSVLEQTAVELRRAAGEARARWSVTAWLSLAALAVAAVIPFLSLPGVHVDSLADTAYLALAATALGLTVGPAGLPSLGTGAFMAIGAFTSALLVARSGWPLEPAVLAGTAAALVAGVLCGGVVRLRRAFVAVSTWLLAWLVWLFLLAFPSVSGGSQGLILPPRSLLGLDATPTVHFEVALALIALTALAVAAVRRGAPGLELSALRQRAGARDLARRPARAATARRVHGDRRDRRARGRALGAAGRRSPTRSATTRSSPSSCSSPCCSAVRRRRSGRPSA